MSKKTPAELKAMVAQSQAWSEMRDRRDDLVRLAQSPPATKEDVRLVHRCVQVCAGEVLLRQGQNI